MKRVPVPRTRVLVSAMVAAACAVCPGLGASNGPRFVTFEEAGPVLEAARASASLSLPADLADRDAAAWTPWLAARDAEIRGRVQRGEEDSIAYLLLFGTSFTAAPRITARLPEELVRQQRDDGRSSQTLDEAVAQAMNTRLDDFIRGLQAPGSNERLAWARATLDRLGHRLDTAQGQLAVRQYLLQTYLRVRRESASLAVSLARAREAPDRDHELALRARLFAARGLAPDTSWPIGFAVAQALRALTDPQTRGPGSVRRVAIIGPGLDFIDKDEGHDHYPPQSLQPFAVIDALTTLGLASAEGLQVTAIDLSPRVMAHISALAARPPTQPYDLQLVRDGGVTWTPAALRYWSEFGAAIGHATAPIDPPATAGGLERRAVRVRPDVVSRIRALDLDIVCQRVDLAEGERFDLVVATNVLIYYGLFDQALAASNIAHMMTTGGLLVTNTRVDDVPAFPLERVLQADTAFSSRPGDGEHLFVYRHTRP